jgi:ribonuclease HI
MLQSSFRTALCRRTHHRTICGCCGADYGFVINPLETCDGYPRNESSSQSTPGISESLPIKSITIFDPPTTIDKPGDLFHGQIVKGNLQCRKPRFVSRVDPKDILIYTDGACSNNGRANARAGSGFIFRPPVPLQLENGDVVAGKVSLRLETRGVDGKIYPQTSNRAELRGVIAALQFTPWHREGWRRLIIATDSEYVVKGVTEWVFSWQLKHWKNGKGHPVKNQDLWKLLLEEIRRLHNEGLDVAFWRTPRAFNIMADNAAKEGSMREEVEHFTEVRGSGL